MPTIKDPNAIVRVKNNMTGSESHFMYQSTDGQRSYHIPAGASAEMRWRDYLEIQQYERVRQLLSLHDDTFVTVDGEVLLDNLDVSELIPYEEIHELLAFPEESFKAKVKTMKKANLVRVKEVADEQNRHETVALLEEAIKSLGGRPSKKSKSETKEE